MIVLLSTKGFTNMTIREENVHVRDPVHQGHVSVSYFTPFAFARESFASQLCLPTALTHGRFASSLCLCLCLDEERKQKKRDEGKRKKKKREDERARYLFEDNEAENKMVQVSSSSSESDSDLQFLLVSLGQCAWVLLCHEWMLPTTH